MYQFIYFTYHIAGGDCECLCTVVAAYAHQCAMSGVSIIYVTYNITGGDCECLCTVVAAYAHQCAVSGVSIYICYILYYRR